MRRRAMRGRGRVAALHDAVGMGGDARALVHHLEHGRGQAHRDIGRDESIRNAVEMALDGNVIVGVYLRRLPLGQLIP